MQSQILIQNEERTALRTFFTQKPEKRTEAELILPTCSNEDVVAYLKDLLKSDQPGASGIASLTSGIAGLQLQDKQIWVRYNDEHVSIKQSSLEDLAVSNVDDLKVIIKNRFKLSGNITIRSGGDNLEDSELITGLYNTKDNALEVIVEENDDDGSPSDEEGEEDVSNIELDQVEKAFRIEYQGSTLDIFYSRLIQFHSEWLKQTKPYAPYLTIIQSSGSGKSRLVGELRTKGVFVLYICKRNETSTGYPASTPCVQQIFEAIHNNKFGILLSLAIKQIKTKNWNEGEFWSIQTKVEHKSECRDFWNSIFKSLEQVELSSDCSNKNFVTDLFPDREISVVCCIDEAHTLLAEHTDNETYFVQWRRQIRKISWSRFFNILLSTNGKIGNFLLQ